MICKHLGAWEQKFVVLIQSRNQRKTLTSRNALYFHKSGASGLDNRDDAVERSQFGALRLMVRRGPDPLCYHAVLSFYCALSILQAQLVSRNMDKSITHQAIVQLSEVFQLFHGHHHGNGNLSLSAFRVQNVPS